MSVSTALFVFQGSIVQLYTTASCREAREELVLVYCARGVNLQPTECHRDTNDGNCACALTGRPINDVKSTSG